MDGATTFSSSNAGLLRWHMIVKYVGDEAMHHNKLSKIANSEWDLCFYLSPEHWLCLSTLLSPPSFVPRRSCLAASSSDIAAYTSTKHQETRPPVQAWTRVWRIALVRSCHIHAKKATWWSSRNSVQCRKRICTDTWKWTLNVANSTLGPRPYQNLVQEHGMCLTFFGGGDSRKL